MARKSESHLDDTENPEWTVEDFARARPAREILPAELYDKLAKKRGRPKAAARKVSLTIRVDRDVLEAYKATGRSWQTRMNEALRQGAHLAPIAKTKRSA